MRKIHFLFVLLLLSFAFPTRDDRPNVVLIMVDDMGWSDLGCYGGEIETPVLDRLASRGVRFTHFYNTAKCAQTRAALLSGLYHPEVKVEKLSHCMTLAEVMRASGYFTMMTGKWHLGKEPTDRGFDRYFGHLSGATNFFKGNKSFRLNGEPFRDFGKDFYTTNAFTDYAISFLKEADEAKKPFFLYMAHNAPHYPLQAPKEAVEKYIGKYRVGWDEIRRRRYARQKELGILEHAWPLSPRPENVPAWEGLPEEKKEWEDLRMAAFAAMVDVVDRNVGRLVDFLKKEGKLENTLLLFLSDNGACPFERTKNPERKPWEPDSYVTYNRNWAHACNTPWRLYKQNQHEGGISTPLIAHWPKGISVPAGSMEHRPGHLVDIMATLLELTGFDYPENFGGQSLKPLRGKSLLPFLQGKEREEHETLYFHYAGKKAIRRGKWKLVCLPGEPWELYDIVADRTELNDLSGKHPALVEELSKCWEEWAKEVDLKVRKKKRKRKK